MYLRTLQLLFGFSNNGGNRERCGGGDIRRLVKVLASSLDHQPLRFSKYSKYFRSEHTP